MTSCAACGSPSGRREICNECAVAVWPGRAMVPKAHTLDRLPPPTTPPARRLAVVGSPLV
jgi:hypothetical protein